MREPAYRLYNCERCGVQVRICQRCDHGNVYCAGECAGIRRRESLKGLLINNLRIMSTSHIMLFRGKYHGHPNEIQEIVALDE
jgi:late competence protein required for DNA uptake (superfamily II DNA/RNA helicase)